MSNIATTTISAPTGTLALAKSATNQPTISTPMSGGKAPYNVIMNWNATALPGYTTAVIQQDFSTSPYAPNNSVFVPSIKPGVYSETVKLVQPNKSNKSNSAAESPRIAYYNTGQDGEMDGPEGPFGTANDGRNGMDGQYIGIVNGAEYTITFLAHPVQFFSFAFNNLDTDDVLTLTYADKSTFSMNGFDMLNGASIVGGQTPHDIFSYPNDWGRVSYDMGKNPGIVSASFSSGSGRWYIDSIAFATPEPATWAMMIFGFGIAGASIRRRRRQNALAAA